MDFQLSYVLLRFHVISFEPFSLPPWSVSVTPTTCCKYRSVCVENACDVMIQHYHRLLFLQTRLDPSSSILLNLSRGKSSLFSCEESRSWGPLSPELSRCECLWCRFSFAAFSRSFWPLQRLLTIATTFSGPLLQQPFLLLFETFV